MLHQTFSFSFCFCLLNILRRFPRILILYFPLIFFPLYICAGSIANAKKWAKPVMISVILSVPLAMLLLSYIFYVVKKNKEQTKTVRAGKVQQLISSVSDCLTSLLMAIGSRIFLISIGKRHSS